MISPEYLSHMLGLLQIHKEYTESVYSDIVRRLVKTDFNVTETAAYQAEILQQSGMCYNDIIMRIAAEKGKIGKEIKTAFENAETEIFDCDDEILTANGIEPIRFKSLSPAMSKMFNAALGRTTGEILNLTGTTASTAQSAFINSCNLAYMQLASGAFDYRTAIKNAIISAAKQDVSVLYPFGHISSLDAAVRRAVLTGFNTTVIKLQEMRADEFDIDIMELTAHFGARPTHAEWQGQLVSRSGKSGYLSLDDIGYGRVDGFMGANCRHDWNMFFEGYSSRRYSDDELSRLKNTEVRYNGETIPAYRAIQKQRAMERSVKEVKRELVCINEGIKHTTNKDLSQELTAEFEKKAVRLKQREIKLADFCEQTGLARDRFREAQFAVKTEKELAAWTKSVSGKAVAAFEKHKLPNYKQAVIPDEKLSGYALNINHPTGKNKAIAFEKYLGYNINNKDMLIKEIRAGLRENIATERKRTEHGRPFEVKMRIKGANGKYANVKSAWQIDNDSDVPRLISIYVKGD